MRSHWKVLFAVAAMSLLLLVPSQALAKEVVATLGGASAGTAGSAFNTPRGLAVNQAGAGGAAAGSFYVVDSNNNRIQRFSPTGQFVAAWGWGVATNANAFEVCTLAETCKKGKSGTGAGEFGSNGAQGIAIDQSNGVVYVADQVNRRIDAFSATGTFLGAFGWGALNGAGSLQFCNSLTGCGAPGTTAPASGNVGGGQFGAAIGGLAVDSAHNVYVADKTSRRVDVFKPTFPVPGVITGIEFVRALGWGAATGAAEFQVCTTATCHAPAAAGAALGQFATGNPIDVAVDSEGNIFALDNNTTKRVQKFNSTPEPLEAFGQAALSATFGTGELQSLAVDPSETPNHVLVSGKRSASGNKVAVAELDSTGASVATHGSGLTANLGNGLAVAQTEAGGAIFLSTTNGGQLVFVLNDAPAPTIDPVAVHGATTATFSGTVPSNGAPVSYHFEYSTDGLSWKSTPAGSVDSSPGSVAVSQEVEGLSGSQLYHLRLRASRQTPGGTVTSSETTFSTDATAPVISAQAISDRRDTSVTLQGQINPENQATTYHFAYVDQADFEASGYDEATEVPVPEASAGSGNAPVTVSRAITGLLPSTTYHFHLVATNGTGTSEGEETTFMTFQALGDDENCPNEAVRAVQRSDYLGECRAIELVNNPDKGNQNTLTDQPLIGTPPISSSGEEVIWSVVGGAPGGTTGTGTSFMAERAASGWQSRSLPPAASDQVGEGEWKYQIEAASPDLKHFAVMAGRSAFGGLFTPDLLRLDRNQQQAILSSYPNSNLSLQNGNTGVDINNDGSHIYFTNPESGQLEDVGSGTPKVISTMPDGLPSECGLAEESGSFSFVGPSGPRFGASANWRPGYHRFADDGSVVYFEARPNGDCGQPFGLYVRDLQSETSSLIDQGVNGFDSYVVRATPDGRHVYFVSDNQLESADQNNSADIYRWDFDSAEYSCLTCIVPDANLLRESEVPTTVLVSDDFSHIYFQSESELIPGKGALGDANIYVLSEGELRFVADPMALESLFGQVGFALDAMLSGDGHVLFFRAEPYQGLTPDAAASSCQSGEGKFFETCKQLYRYDDHSENVVCVSCVQGGVSMGAVDSGSSAHNAPFSISDDGSTAAFVTASALLPRDINGSSDIYEWRNGAAHLLTDGVRSFPASVTGAPAVRGISSDGGDIFFSLVDPGRTGFERDGVANLYDARIDGGFLPPAPPQHCSEESCQGPLQAAPELSRAGSASFDGPGNERAQARKSKSRCKEKRGKAKRRCVHGHKKKQKGKATHNAGGNK